MSWLKASAPLPRFDGPARIVLTISGFMVVAASTTGCADNPPLPIARTVQPSQHPEIDRVVILPHSNGLLVRGRMRRPNLMQGPIWGHVHIAALAENGRQLANADVRTYSLHTYGYRAATFQVLLQTQRPEDVARVSIEYRSEPVGSPVHDRSTNNL